MQNQTHILTLVKKLMKNILSLKLVRTVRIVRIPKYKNIFANCYTPNCSEEIFVIKKVKNIVTWTYVINDLNREETVGTFYEKNCKKQIKKSLELKK